MSKRFSTLDMQGNEIINCPSLVGGGDSKLLNDVTSNVQVGAINSNQKIDKDTTFTEFVEKLLRKDITPTISISATGSGLHEVGTTVNGTIITATISNLSSVTVGIDKIDFKVGNSIVDTQQFVQGKQAYSFVVNDPITSNTTVSAVLTYETSKTTSASANFKFVYASYYGEVSSTNPSPSDITAMTKTVKDGKGLTWNNANLSDSRFCYAYPSSMGNLTSIKDANNFEYINSYTKSTVNIDGTNYNVYVLTDPVTISNAKQIYA